MNNEILSIETTKKLAEIDKLKEIIKEQSIGIEKLKKRRTTYHNKYLKEKHKNIELMKENRRLCKHVDMWNRFYNEEFDKNKKVEEQYERIYEKTKDFGRTQFVKEIQLQINDNENKDKEITRLNNIINDLEEYIIYKHNLFKANMQGMSWSLCEDILNKLKELRGDSDVED